MTHTLGCLILDRSSVPRPVPSKHKVKSTDPLPRHITHGVPEHYLGFLLRFVMCSHAKRKENGHLKTSDLNSIAFLLLQTWVLAWLDGC